MFTFRTSLTFAVMAFIVALAVLLIAIQILSLRWATHEAASAYMDATSAKALGRLRTEISTMTSLVHVLATSSSVADSNERTETGHAIPLFKAALQELPQMDSVYAGFENGAWLQVRRIDDLNDEQRGRLRATPEANIAINLVRPTPSGDLPMRRIFEDQQGNQVGQLDLWKYGYDARKRSWYRETVKADRALVSSPYLSFSIGAPVITVSAPLRGKVSGVLAADLKLDSFSEFVQAQRPGAHGSVLIFDSTGALIAHPNFAQFVVDAMTHPSQPQLPSIKEINSGVVQEALRRSDGRDHYDGSIRDDQRAGLSVQGDKIQSGWAVRRQHIVAGGPGRLCSECTESPVHRTIPRDCRQRCFYSGHLDIWRRNVSIPERHYCPSSQTPDAGCARSLVSHVTH